MRHNGSGGDSPGESPPLPHHTTPIDVVIPNESREAGEVRNLQLRKTVSWHKKKYILYA
jgi:hypothetical protein